MIVDMLKGRSWLDVRGGLNGLNIGFPDAISQSNAQSCQGQKELHHF